MLMSCQARRRRHVRAVFVSDVHLGCRYADAPALLRFLRSCAPDFLYIVGDFIDGWRLRKRWHWTPDYSQILLQLLEMVENGTQIIYTPGNHDEFMRHFLVDVDAVRVADECVHETADQRRLLVIHGHQFDTVELRAQWLSVVGGFAYDALIWADIMFNRLCRWLRLPGCRFSAAAKVRVKQAVRFISGFERRLVQYAAARRCDGVVCGHIHTPVVTRYDGMTYCNTGDWIENRTALLEYECGGLQIVDIVPSSEWSEEAAGAATLAPPAHWSPRESEPEAESVADMELEHV